MHYNYIINGAIDTFIIETVLIAPISDILNKLDNNEFRDCDVKWLENKMRGFLDFAAQTLKVQVPVVSLSEEFGIMNEYTKQRFTEGFKTLLDYFKSF